MSMRVWKRMPNSDPYASEPQIRDSKTLNLRIPEPPLHPRKLQAMQKCSDKAASISLNMKVSRM